MLLYVSLLCFSSNVPSTLIPQGLGTCCFLYMELFPQMTAWFSPAHLSGICSNVTSERPSLTTEYKTIYSLTFYCAYFAIFFFIVLT